MTIELKSAVNGFLKLNQASLFLSVLLMVIIVAAIIFKLEASKRLSFRFYFLIGFADMLNHICMLFDYSKSKELCHFLNNLSFFSNYLFVFVNLVLAYNLHCIFLKRKKELVLSEKTYLWMILGSSVLLTLPLVLLSGTHVEVCPIWDIVKSPNDLLLMYGLFGIWVIVPIIYCTIIFFMVLFKIIQVSYFPKKRASIESNISTQMLKEYTGPPITSSILRLILYPIVPSITLLPYIVLYSLKDYIPLSSWISIMVTYFSATSAGTINFIFFLFDPAILSLWKSLTGKEPSSPSYHRASLPNETRSFSSNLTLLNSTTNPEIFYLL